MSPQPEQENFPTLAWNTIPFPPHPTIITQRLFLRPLHIADAPVLASKLNDPSILQWTSDRVANPYTLAHAEEFINRNHPNADGSRRADNAVFAIVLATSSDGEDDNGAKHHELQGIIGLEVLTDVFRRGTELGYWLAPTMHGSGYATEAATAAVDWAFGLASWINGTGPLLRVVGNVTEGNEKSCRVLQKVGLVREGVARDAVWKEGEVRSSVMWGMTRRDWVLSKGGMASGQ